MIFDYVKHISMVVYRADSDPENVMSNFSQDFVDGYMDAAAEFDEGEETWNTKEEHAKSLSKTLVKGTPFRGASAPLFVASGLDDNEKGYLRGCVDRAQVQENKPTIQQKRDVAGRAFDTFCLHNGINWTRSDPVIPPDADLASASSAREVYNMAKRYAVYKEIHLMY